MEERMKHKLARRRQEGTLRTFRPMDELLTSTKADLGLDFSSNDYLGLAHCSRQLQLVHDSWNRIFSSHATLGATGSRLLSGDSFLCRRLEVQLAQVHHSESALLSNSGYDANLSILSSVPMDGDVVIMDELAHNSLVMGIRMSRLLSKAVHAFRHNDIKHLRDLLTRIPATKRRHVLIVVESVYSMDGDVAPLAEILDLAYEFSARVMVDEAHGLGVYGASNAINLVLPEEQTSVRVTGSEMLSLGGTGVLAALGLEAHPALLCSVFTYGKAAGCHGAVVCGSQVLVDYLVNYARPFIYSTALPTHSLLAIECAYKSMTESHKLRTRVFELVELFRCRILAALSKDAMKGVYLWPSPSPIQALVVPGNDVCVRFCRFVRNKCGVVLYPIRSPTVPRGKERVRIILHAHNSPATVLELVQVIVGTLKEMKLWQGSSRL